MPDDDGQPQQQAQPWNHNELIPVRVILRDFVTSKYFPTEHEKGESSHLLEFINSVLANKSSAEYYLVLQARLRRGEVLLLLDGLDEVPQADKLRERMIQCVRAVLRIAPGHSLISNGAAIRLRAEAMENLWVSGHCTGQVFAGPDTHVHRPLVFKSTGI